MQRLASADDRSTVRARASDEGAYSSARVSSLAPALSRQQRPAPGDLNQVAESAVY